MVPLFQNINYVVNCFLDTNSKEEPIFFINKFNTSVTAKLYKMTNVTKKKKLVIPLTNSPRLLVFVQGSAPVGLAVTDAKFPDYGLCSTDCAGCKGSGT